MPEISTCHVVFTGTPKHPTYIVEREELNVIKSTPFETGVGSSGIGNNMVVTRAQHVSWHAGQK